MLAAFIGASPLSEREIVSTRLFPYPPVHVFEAWTDPERLARWWGPNGFCSTFHQFDLRPGGNWRFTMHGPDGKDYPNHSVFVEIEKPERIVFDHISGPRFQMTASFEEMGGTTNLTLRMLFEKREIRDAMKAVCVPSNEQNFDRLQAELDRAA